MKFVFLAVFIYFFTSCKETASPELPKPMASSKPTSDSANCQTSFGIAENPVSYYGTIKAILDANCATSSCHNAKVQPNLSSYADAKANSTDVLASVLANRMPQDYLLDTNTKSLIKSWVEGGSIEGPKPTPSESPTSSPSPSPDPTPSASSMPEPTITEEEKQSQTTQVKRPSAISKSKAKRCSS